MTYFIFAIRDTVAGTFGAPFLQVNQECGKREFLVRTADSKIKGDLSLYCVGVFNVETGEIVPELTFCCSGIKEASDE